MVCDWYLKGFLKMNDKIENSELFQRLLKEFLKVTYKLTLKYGSFSPDEFRKDLKRTQEETKALISVLRGMGMIQSVNDPIGNFRITTGGVNNLKVILTGGVFDIVHLGHIKTLEESRDHGDILLVVVASDETVKRSKGRLPINSQESRMVLLSHLDVVDVVLKGSPDPSKFLEIIEEYQPDTITLGYDQFLTEAKLAEMLTKIEKDHIEIIRLKATIPDEKSSQKMKNLDEYSFDY